MVYGLPNIKLSSGICEGCMIGKHLKHKFEKGKQGEPPYLFNLFIMISMDPFLILHGVILDMS